MKGEECYTSMFMENGAFHCGSITQRHDQDEGTNENHITGILEHNKHIVCCMPYGTIARGLAFTLYILTHMLVN